MSARSPLRVLFLCTHNSARSQMAEGWAHPLGGDWLTVQSAGIEAQSAGNLKRTWVNHARARDWSGPEGQGPVFLRQATAVKTIWIPYGE